MNNGAAAQPGGKSFQTFLLVWAVLATVAALTFAAGTLLLFMRGQQRERAEQTLLPAKDFSASNIESGIYYKYNNIARELEEPLLQKQARVLTEKYSCSPVQLVRIASAPGLGKNKQN